MISGGTDSLQQINATAKEMESNGEVVGDIHEYIMFSHGKPHQNFGGQGSSLNTCQVAHTVTYMDVSTYSCSS